MHHSFQQNSIEQQRSFRLVSEKQKELEKNTPTTSTPTTKEGTRPYSRTHTYHHNHADNKETHTIERLNAQKSLYSTTTYKATKTTSTTTTNQKKSVTRRRPRKKQKKTHQRRQGSEYLDLTWTLNCFCRTENTRLPAVKNKRNSFVFFLPLRPVLLFLLVLISFCFSFLLLLLLLLLGPLPVIPRHRQGQESQRSITRGREPDERETRRQRETEDRAKRVSAVLNEERRGLTRGERKGGSVGRARCNMARRSKGRTRPVHQLAANEDRK